MAYETLSTHLVGIVNDIRTRSLTYATQDGVMKALVARKGGVGYSLYEPYIDPTTNGATAYTASTGTEGTDASTITRLAATRLRTPATERYFRTFMTDKSVRESVEQVKTHHSEAHGYVHAMTLEQHLLGFLASGTSSIVASAAARPVTWAKLAAARTLLEGVPKAAPKPYNFVCSPESFYWFAANMVGSSNYYVQDASVSGEILRKYHVASLVGGVNIYQSAYFTASGTGYQNAGMFSKSGIHLFAPDGADYTLESQRDASMRGYELISTMTYGGKANVKPYIVTVKAYSGTPS